MDGTSDAAMIAADRDRAASEPLTTRVSRRTVYRNRWMTIVEDSTRLPDGSDGLYGIVTMRPYALVIPVLRDESVLLVDQFRYPTGHFSLELPQGTAERADLSPAETAAAELAEETGAVAAELVPFGTFHPAVGYSTQECFAFVARDLTFGASRPEPSELGIRTYAVAFDELDRMLDSGFVTDLATVAAWGLFTLRYR
ncbi:MAG: NUDIX hydrolase [Microthrixaceae bacterium]